MNSESRLAFTGERYVPQLRGAIYYEHVHRYAVAAALAGGRRVLDIASGEGYGSALLAKSAAEVIGVDCDTETVDHARSEYRAPNLRFLCGQCESIPLADASVDIVVSFETIEHIRDVRSALAEIRRVLAPDGLLLLSSPNKAVYDAAYGADNPFHTHEMDLAELQDVLQTHFEHVSIYGQRLVGSSLIFPLDETPNRPLEWYSGDVQNVCAQFPLLRDPVYHFALCGPRGTAIDLASLFIDAADDIWADLFAKVLQAQPQHDGDTASIGPALRSLAAALELEISDPVDLFELVAALRSLASGARGFVARWRAERVELSRAHLVALEVHERRAAESERLRVKEVARIALREHEELTAMLASRSWRVTRPLRSAGTWLRSRLKR